MKTSCLTHRPTKAAGETAALTCSKLNKMKQQLSDKSKIQSKHSNDSESCFSIYISNITKKINSTVDFQAFDKEWQYFWAILGKKTEFWGAEETEKRKKTGTNVQNYSKYNW